MYKQTSLGDGRTMTAVSVPPAADESISDAFKELSRIHFYLGYKPIDFMIDAVASASLDEIARGQLQLEFASKEIQEFLNETAPDVSFVLNTNPDDKAYYFNETFSEVLGHVETILKGAFENPNNQENAKSVPYVANLANQVIVFNDYLKEAGIETEDLTTKISSIKRIYAELQRLTDIYTPLSGIKDFDNYKTQAIADVKEQLTSSVDFRYESLAKIYDPRHDDSWAANVHYHYEFLDKLNKGEAQVDQRRAQELKELAVTQFTALSQMFGNGIVPAVKTRTIRLSYDLYLYSQKNQLSPESRYQSKVSQVKHFEKLGLGDRDRDELQKLESKKEELIAIYNEDKNFYNKALSVRQRELENINSAFASVKEKVLNIKPAPTITFTGNIDDGFVVGVPSTGNNLVLVHKDPFVNVKEAVYAMVMPKAQYEEHLANNTLVFTEDFRNQEVPMASNFWSYGQFLNEVGDEGIQKMFFGNLYTLIDRTQKPVFNSEHSEFKDRQLLHPKKEVSWDDLGDDIPF